MTSVQVGDTPTISAAVGRLGGGGGGVTDSSLGNHEAIDRTMHVFIDQVTSWNKGGNDLLGFEATNWTTALKDWGDVLHSWFPLETNWSSFQSILIFSIIPIGQVVSLYNQTMLYHCTLCLNNWTIMHYTSTVFISNDCSVLCIYVYVILPLYTALWNTKRRLRMYCIVTFVNTTQGYHCVFWVCTMTPLDTVFKAMPLLYLLYITTIRFVFTVLHVTLHQFNRFKLFWTASYAMLSLYALCLLSDTLSRLYTA
jgi:hypothetical protein